MLFMYKSFCVLTKKFTLEDSMTSPVSRNTSNDWSKDPRWGEAQTEREAGHESNRQSDHHMARAIDHAGDKHFGSVLEEVGRGLEKAGEAREHYSNANRKENEVLQDACKSKR